MENDPELRLVESIYEALDDQHPDRALALARQALSSGGADDPIVHFLAGVASLELDLHAEAVAALEEAVRIDPEEPEFRANLALALYRGCRFAEAADHVRQALEVDAGLPDAHHVHGLLLERADDFAGADRCFEQAHRLDPDAFPLPLRWTRSEFEQRVSLAGDVLPQTFRKRLGEVVVTVEELPSDDILGAEEPPLDPELLGLFVGVPLSEGGSFSPGGELPPRILIFKRNLERCFGDSERLDEEIARTLYHELGHYLGLDEEELEQMDLG